LSDSLPGYAAVRALAAASEGGRRETSAALAVGGVLLLGSIRAGRMNRRAQVHGVPFLHPQANRLSGLGYRANGHDVAPDPSSPLILLDDNGVPIHGVLTASRERSLRELAARDDRATVVATLDFDRPKLLAAFPFPHRIEVLGSPGASGASAHHREKRRERDPQLGQAVADKGVRDHGGRAATPAR
jgi:hypothetical protein